MRKSTQSKLFFSCQICFDNYEKEHLCLLECGHAFHRHCIQETLKSHGSSSAPCPNCRVLFNDIKLAKVFLEEHVIVSTDAELEEEKKEYCKKYNDIKNKFEDLKKEERLYRDYLDGQQADLRKQLELSEFHKILAVAGQNDFKTLAKLVRPEDVIKIPDLIAEYKQVRSMAMKTQGFGKPFDVEDIESDPLGTSDAISHSKALNLLARANEQLIYRDSILARNLEDIANKDEIIRLLAETSDNVTMNSSKVINALLKEIKRVQQTKEEANGVIGRFSKHLDDILAISVVRKGHSGGASHPLDEYHPLIYKYKENEIEMMIKIDELEKNLAEKNEIVSSYEGVSDNTKVNNQKKQIKDLIEQNTKLKEEYTKELKKRDDAHQKKEKDLGNKFVNEYGEHQKSKSTILKLEKELNDEKKKVVQLGKENDKNQRQGTNAVLLGKVADTLSTLGCSLQSIGDITIQLFKDYENSEPEPIQFINKMKYLIYYFQQNPLDVDLTKVDGKINLQKLENVFEFYENAFNNVAMNCPHVNALLKDNEKLKNLIVKFKNNN
uniref:RING-type domain-containing protein n=1 Tax=Rhabditophanes sp. KR3021 TaxID=114890 RepID=A0AC35TNY0_9BILA